MVEQNIKNYSYHPTDYIHGLLSKHAYVNSQKGAVELGPNFDEYLKDWRVAEVFDDTATSGYYGAIYINDNAHQIVLANINVSVAGDG